MRSSSRWLVLLASPLVLQPSTAIAQHDDHGTEQAKRGLGQSFPNALNQSLHPNWHVYEFERDGISYYQVNDMAGRLHLIVAKAGDAFWSLPAGESGARISLPAWPQLPHPTSVPIEVYRDSEFALILHNDSNDAMWSIELIR
ncbi:hypothetical protein J7J08_09380 [Stenotrophomonas sp. ISL-67]|uniref:hypothetical protein n=1 Tax=Stenotrophomonas sp. ISL-67 TaxID=2819171 RepID=UPI001BE60582|nr:hypothetical protein [Stenotrophomonas sp. ISL-67]MBT2767851.1 hypothetical protein [Stenotrophomonas sp. ISL-67]